MEMGSLWLSSQRYETIYSSPIKKDKRERWRCWAEEKRKKELEAKNAEERIKEYAIEILDDKDLDFSKSANVEKILNKYKNTQNNRRNFEPDQ